jgi:hypothetical protein
MDLPIWIHEEIKRCSQGLNVTQGQATAIIFSNLLKEMRDLKAANDSAEPDDLAAGE